MRVVLAGKTGFGEVLTDHFLEDNFLKVTIDKALQNL